MDDDSGAAAVPLPRARLNESLCLIRYVLVEQHVPLTSYALGPGTCSCAGIRGPEHGRRVSNLKSEPHVHACATGSMLFWVSDCTPKDVTKRHHFVFTLRKGCVHFTARLLLLHHGVSLNCSQLCRTSGSSGVLNVSANLCEISGDRNEVVVNAKVSPRTLLFIHS